MFHAIVLLVFFAGSISAELQNGAILIQHPSSSGVPDSRLIAACLKNDQLSMQLEISYSPFRSGQVQFTINPNSTCSGVSNITVLNSNGSSVTSIGSPSVFTQAKDCGATDFFDTNSNQLTRWWNVNVQESYVEGNRQRQLISTVNVICQMTPEVPEGELNPVSPLPPVDLNNNDTILSPLHFM